jgi:hypothetical protein
MNAPVAPHRVRDMNDFPSVVAGVPTGANYAKLIDEAVATVEKVATDNNYARIFFSADSHGHLGTGTFMFGGDVKAYIVKKLKALES